jgi:hypothetical protein
MLHGVACPVGGLPHREHREAFPKSRACTTAHAVGPSAYRLVHSAWRPHHMGVYTVANSVYHQALKSCTIPLGLAVPSSANGGSLWQREARSHLIPRHFCRK